MIDNIRTYFLFLMPLFFVAPVVAGAVGMDEMMMPDVSIDVSKIQMCDSKKPSSWRDAQTIEGVVIEEDLSCNPDMPALIVAATKGTNNVSIETLNETGLAPDAVIKGEDRDGDGDPDVITINLEIWGMNEGENPLTTYEIAPGIDPAFWVFAPKGTGMVTEGMSGAYLVRMPSPSIRVEEGDEVKLIVSNTHYLPHTLHLHGVDHPYVDENGEGNDGVPQTSELPIMPGESREYNLTPRHAGTMAYHCHVQPQVHVLMGLSGMFIIEENKPNNWLQTLNVGAGKVRHRSVASLEEYDGEFDLHYQDIDKEIHEALKKTDDPAKIARMTNREYDVTERTADYYILNGKSFPYTLRESQLIVDPDSKYRLRVFNIGSNLLSLHTHGHKVLVKALDGVDLNPAAQYYRDVVELSAAQRADLVLSTKDDGLNSYGEGVWLFHDHDESHITTDGIVPGGNLSFITYRKYLGENGFPILQGADIRPTFTPEYYQKKVPIWDTYDTANMFRVMFTDREGAKTLRSITAAVVIFIGVCGGYLLSNRVFAKKTKKNKNKGSIAVKQMVLVSMCTLLLIFLASSATIFAEEIEGMDGIHIMPDSTVMLGTGETVSEATIDVYGMIIWPDGRLIKPVMDMRSPETIEAHVARLTDNEIVPVSANESNIQAESMDISRMDSGEESSEKSYLGMDGIDGIHIMPNGSVMLGNGLMLTDVQIVGGGMIVLGSGETVKPVLDMRGGDGIRRTEYSMVVNENFDRLPLGCAEISGKQSITVKAGVKIAADYPGTMFTYDEHTFDDIPPCTLLTVTFQNMDNIRHQFMVHNLPPETYPMGMFNIEITGPASETGTFITPPDDVTLFVHCGVPEHEAKGMVAQIKIGGGDGDFQEVLSVTAKLKKTKDFLSTNYLYILGLMGLGFGFLVAYFRRKSYV